MDLSCSTRRRMRDCSGMRWGALLIFSSLISFSWNAEAGTGSRGSSGGAQSAPFGDGGAHGGSIEIVPVPLDVLRSSEFSTLLATYSEDVEYERKEMECRFWIDVDHVKSQSVASAKSGVAASEDSQKTDYFSQYGGDCSTLNREFGAQLVESASGPLNDRTSAFVKCTAAPWFAEVEIQAVTRKRGPGGSFYSLAELSYTYPSFLAAADTSRASGLPLTVPLTPDKQAQRSGHFKPPAPGDKATLLCLAEGSRMMLIRDTEDATQAGLEFLPGPWSIEVEVEMYPDPLRVMGVGVQLRLMENLAVTLPPTRVLPVTTAGLTGEQWLLLELAELRSRERRQRETAEAGASVDFAFGEEILALSSRTQMQPPHFPIGPCQLRRRKGFNEPILLDCLPPIQPQNRRELLMNAFDIAKRGAWGIACALLAAMSINGPFHSLIKTRHVNAEALDTVAHDLSLFSVSREWKVAPPSSSQSSEEDSLKELTLNAMSSWTPEQSKELDIIASEVLEAYARGGKDRRKHTQEKHMIFVETDSKLEVRLAISSLSRSRRKLLGLNKCTDAELVFTFTDLGGSFRPFTKIPKANLRKVSVSEQPKHESASETNDPVEEDQNRAVSAPSVAPDADADVASPSENEGEERMTMLQLMWQNVVKPQHDELRKIAIGNVLWDISVAAFFLAISALSAKLLGFVNGKATAAALQDSRAARFTGFAAYDLPVIPGPQENVNVADFRNFELLSQSEAAALSPDGSAATVEVGHDDSIVTGNVKDVQQR
ncbi:hypothetical protein Emag_002607 [Eimeria magna]